MIRQRLISSLLVLAMLFASGVSALHSSEHVGLAKQFHKHVSFSSLYDDVYHDQQDDEQAQSVEKLCDVCLSLANLGVYFDALIAFYPRQFNSERVEYLLGAFNHPSPLHYSSRAPPAYA